MYNFHYNFMKKKIRNCTLLFTGTDNLYFKYDEDPHEIMY